MVRVKKLKQRAQSGACIPSPWWYRFNETPSIRCSSFLGENVVCSRGNGLGYQEGVELFVVATNNVFCPDRIENLYLVRGKKDKRYFYNRKQVFSVLKDYQVH